MRELIPKEAGSATHYKTSVSHKSGGRTEVTYLWFKKTGDEWYVFTTDPDNEYPGWVKESIAFFRAVPKKEINK